MSIGGDFLTIGQTSKALFRPFPGITIVSFKWGTATAQDWGTATAQTWG